MNNNPANSILSGLLILLITIFSPITLNGQDLKEDLKDWIAEYILLNSQRNDASVPSMKIYNYYINASDEDKLALEESISKVAFTFVSEGKTEYALSATNLYELLPIESQKLNSQIYFTKGYCYAALCDSINLKSIISKLQRYPKTTFYTSVLNSYLDEMRKPVTSLKNLDGWWVSDVLMKVERGLFGMTVGGDIPKYMVDVYEKNDSVLFEINRMSPFNTDICYMTKTFSPDNIYHYTDIKSKIVIPYASDSICVIWSSEDLKNFNADIAQSLRQVTATIGATIAGEVNQRYKYSTSEKIATDMLVDLGETAINAIFDAIFTPSKKIFVLQARLKKINDNILTGKLYFRQTKVKADDSNIKWEEYIDTVTFLRWKPEYDVVFMGKVAEYPLMPYDDISKKVSSQIKSLKNKVKKDLKQYYDSKTRIGINYNLKNDSLVVNYVYSNSPANKSGLKIGDCILTVNKVMVTGQNLDLNAISKIFERGTNSTVSLEILRPSTDDRMVVDVTPGKVKVTDDDIDYVYKMHYENLIVPYWKDVRDDTTGRYGKAVLEYKQSKDKPAFLKEYNTRMINELYKHAINSSSNIK